MGHAAAFGPMRGGVTIHYSLPNLGHAHPGAMAKPTKRKRPESEGVGARIVESEVMLRGAAISYAAVAKLDPSHPDWLRHWRELRRAAFRVVVAIQEAAGHPPRALASRRSATPPTLRRLRRQAAL